MRRIVAVAATLLACGLVISLMGADGDSADGKKFKIEFDNAFGLVEGGDFRVGGVKAGATTDFEAVKKRGEPPKAEVEVEVTEEGFGDFRKDATCAIRPQSLIGEYFVDCEPGQSDEKLDDGATIPVEQTESTIPQDLVNNIMRRPTRERLRLIVAELGTGLAGRPEDLQEVLKRAHPGLRETSKVLKILAKQNDVIEQFIGDADTVVGELEARKKEVSRFIDEAGETAAITATRREELRQTFRKLPDFLQELTPTMARLEDLADEQIPLLSDVQKAAPDLYEFLRLLGPFAEESRPALRALGNASEVGARAFNRGSQEVDELKALAADAPATAKPLRQLLESMDDRRRAIDSDDRAVPNGPPASDPSQNNGSGKGFTAFESIWNYFFWQTLSVNGFDQFGHVLRIGITASECSLYENRRYTAATKAHYDNCNQWLGPNQPGLNAPDPTAGTAAAAKVRSRAGKPARQVGERRAPSQPEAGPLPGQPDISKPQITLPPAVRDLLGRLGVPGTPLSGGKLNDLLGGSGGRAGQGGVGGVSGEKLLDYLMAP